MSEGIELRSCPDVLGSLLHALCQPLTTVRCSLELSLDEDAGHQCNAISAALEQAGRAIDIVQLIREYLELEHAKGPVGPVALAPAVNAVLGQLGIVAEAYRVPLFALGTSTAALNLNEYWLHRALRYLIGSVIEGQPAGNGVAVLLEDHDCDSMLSVHSVSCDALPRRETASSRVPGHFEQATLAIAERVLESAGCSLKMYPGLRRTVVIRIPRAKSLTHRMSA